MLSVLFLFSWLTLLDVTGSWSARVRWVITWPLGVLLYCTVPNCVLPRWHRWFMVTFVASTLWIAVFSYLMVWMVRCPPVKAQMWHYKAQKGCVLFRGFILQSPHLSAAYITAPSWRLFSSWSPSHIGPQNPENLGCIQVSFLAEDIPGFIALSANWTWKQRQPIYYYYYYFQTKSK